MSSLLPLPSTHKFATASLAPCLTTAQSPLLLTSPYNCYGLKILRQAMSILLKSMPFKSSFVETNSTGLFLKILRAKPKNPTTRSLESALHATTHGLQVLRSIHMPFRDLTHSSSIGHTNHFDVLSVVRSTKLGNPVI